jgi:hypothetical protein
MASLANIRLSKKCQGQSVRLCCREWRGRRKKYFSLLTLLEVVSMPNEHGRLKCFLDWRFLFVLQGGCSPNSLRPSYDQNYKKVKKKSFLTGIKVRMILRMIVRMIVGMIIRMILKMIISMSA